MVAREQVLKIIWVTVDVIKKNTENEKLFQAKILLEVKWNTFCDNNLAWFRLIGDIHCMGQKTLT